jgi:hypothetical protein
MTTDFEAAADDILRRVVTSDPRVAGVVAMAGGVRREAQHPGALW